MPLRSNKGMASSSERRASSIFELLSCALASCDRRTPILALSPTIRSVSRALRAYSNARSVSDIER